MKAGNSRRKIMQEVQAGNYGRTLRKDGREGGRKEGRKEGKKEERKEGRNERRK